MMSVFRFIRLYLALVFTGVALCSVSQSGASVNLPDQQPADSLLTQQELQWIAAHQRVNFTGDPNWLPYEAFQPNGEYIGIVTAAGDEERKTYYAVFPFEVGFTGFGYWPLFVAIAVLIQLNYMLMSGRFKRFGKPRLRSVGGSVET